MKERVKEWINEWVNERKSERVNKWMNELSEKHTQNPMAFAIAFAYKIEYPLKNTSQPRYSCSSSYNTRLTNVWLWQYETPNPRELGKAVVKTNHACKCIERGILCFWGDLLHQNKPILNWRERHNDRKLLLRIVYSIPSLFLHQSNSFSPITKISIANYSNADQLL